MSKTLAISAVAILLATASNPVVGQSARNTEAKQALNLLAISGFGTIPKANCTGTPGPDVTVDLGDTLDSLALNGKVARNIKRGGKVVDAPNNVGNNWKTNLDMQLAVQKTGGAYVKNDYVMVTVVLPKISKSKVNLQFLQKYAEPSTDLSNAVMASSQKEADAMFCGRTDIEPWTQDPSAQMVRFGVKWGPVRAYNIGIMIQDKTNNTLWLPIILDPNVQNEG